MATELQRKFKNCCALGKDNLLTSFLLVCCDCSKIALCQRLLTRKSKQSILHIVVKVFVYTRMSETIIYKLV